MGTIIDELVIKLNLDAKGFTSGQKQATSAFQKTKEESISIGKSMEESGKQAAEFFGKIRNAALGMFAAFTAGRGIEQFTRQTISTNAELGRTAENLSMSGRALSAWQKAVELAGGSAGEVTETLEGLRKTYQDMLMGQQPQNSAALSMLGLTKEDLADPEKRLDILIQKVRTFAANPRHTRAQSFEVAREAGLSKGLINLALSPDSEKLLAEGSANAVTESQIKAAQKVQTALVDLQQKWEKLGNFLVERFAGDIEKVVTALGRLADWLQEHPDDLAKVFTVALVAVGLLSKAIIGNLIALALSPLTFALGGITKGAATASAAIAAMGRTTVLGGLLAMLASVAAVVSTLFLKGDTDAKSTPDGFMPGWKPDNGPEPEKPFTGRIETPGEMWRRTMPTWLGGNPPEPEPRLDTFGHPIPSAPRGIRNNNPGNLEFAGQSGATKESGPSGRFAVFKDMPSGVAALASQLKLYAARGLDTIRMIVGKYAPEGENDTSAYIANLSKSLGVSPDQHLDVSNANVLRGLISGISDIENGPGKVNPADINAGLAIHAGQRIQNNTVGPQSSNQTHIGQIVVHTAATDAKGIARDIGTEMRKYGFVAQANMGLS